MPTETFRSLPQGYGFVFTAPGLDDYVHLRTISGLTPKTAEQGWRALVGSWCACQITYNDGSDVKLVGMGRIIGDGGWYFHVVDMAVDPAHQKRGLGHFILSKDD